MTLLADPCPHSRSAGMIAKLQITKIMKQNRICQLLLFFTVALAIIASGCDSGTYNQRSLNSPADAAADN